MQRETLTSVAISFLAAIAGGGLAAEWVITGWEAGNLAEWGAAIGTGGALIVGALALRRQAVEFGAAEQARAISLRRAEEEIRIALQQADIARASLEASIRPLLVEAPEGGTLPHPELVHFDGMANPVRVEKSYAPIFPPVEQVTDPARVAVPLLNVGSGVALVRGVGVRSSRDRGTGWIAAVSRSVVAVQQSTWIVTSVPSDRPELDEIWASVRARSNFILAIRYTNGSGTDDLRSELHVWEGRVRQVFFYHGDSPEPFASTAPSDA